jgi:hypothetical protein
MGLVFLGQSASGRLVAVKVIHPPMNQPARTSPPPWEATGDSACYAFVVGGDGLAGDLGDLLAGGGVGAGNPVTLIREYAQVA